MNEQGLIVTFYSYKGGVGRSFILSNIAAVLSVWGYRVLCIDWDLEAPGLTHYFKPWIKSNNQRGLVDLVLDFAKGTSPSWQDYLIEIELPNAKRTMQLLAAGSQDNDYFTRVQGIEWDRLYKSNDLGIFIESMRTQWKEKFDFVLIDSRTGITDIGGICTVQLPDILAVIVAANQQNIDGAANVIDRCVKQRDKLPYDRGGLIVMPIVARLDIRDDYELGLKWMRIISERFSLYYSNWIPKSVSSHDLTGLTRIPYFSYWSYGERIPVIEEESKNPDSISYHLTTVAALLANRFSETSLLLRNRDSYVNAASNIILGESSFSQNFYYDFFISHAQEEPDLQFTQALVKELRNQGFRVFLPADDIQTGESLLENIEKAIRQAKHLIVVLGEKFTTFQTEEVNAFSEHILRDSTDRRVIPTITSFDSLKVAPPSIRMLSGINATHRSAKRVVNEIVEKLKLTPLEESNANSAKTIVLFVSFAPSDTNKLRLDHEIREVEQKLRLSKNRDKFELSTRISLRPADFTQALLDLQPQIVHFISGNQSDALAFENENGLSYVVSSSALSALFKQFSSQIECVILNRGFSQAQIEAISKHIDYVINIPRQLDDRTAISFVTGFYQALAAGRTFEDAFKLGSVQIMLQGSQEDSIPVLIVKRQIQ